MCSRVAKDPWFLPVDSEDSDQRADAQADLSLRWEHNHIVGFVMRWLKFEKFGHLKKSL